MSQVADLRSLVATMLMMSADELGPGTSLRSLDNSLGGAKLLLGLKRLGITAPFKRIPPTFGDLQNSLAGVSATTPVTADTHIAAEQPAELPPGALRMGHDIQDIKSLPNSADYWEHEFYQGCFGRTELAYAVVQSEPKAHFAGFWAAKEALRKCDPSFIDVDLSLLTIAHDTAGKPYFLYHRPGGVIRLPHAVSISHSVDMASAVVVASK